MSSFATSRGLIWSEKQKSCKKNKENLQEGSKNLLCERRKNSIGEDHCEMMCDKCCHNKLCKLNVEGRPQAQALVSGWL